MRLFSELKRRNVLRMAALYLVAAWLIMQVAEVIVTLGNLPDWIGPTILGLLAVGFPIAIILSWFYELTPEGISLEKDVDPVQSMTSVTGRRMDFIVISLLSAAVLLFAWHTWWPSTPTDKSIAVLAFENMSGDPEQEYFSDGISEELLNVLAEIPGLIVISRSSSFSFKGKDVAAPEIARQLNVAHVLEGSVRRDGNRVRITAQLIEASSDSHLWSETYDRDLDDIFAVQDDISAAIVGALKKRLGLELEAVPSVIVAANTGAHDAYLRGRYLFAKRTRATVEGAIREFENAVALDPEYAPAHAELAIATLSGYAELTDDVAVVRAAPHVKLAMALRPTLAEAHAAAGFLSWDAWNLEEALSHFERAVQLNPNYSDVYLWTGNILHDLGQYAEAFPMYEKAVRLDPLSIVAIHTYAVALMERNRLIEADREVQKLAAIAPCRYAVMRGYLTSLGGKWADRPLAALDAMRIDPADPRCKRSLAQNLALIGFEEEALAISDPDPFVLVMLGRPSDALALLEARIAEDRNYVDLELGLILAHVGDYSRARPILEEWWQRNDGQVAAGVIYAAAQLIAIRRTAGEEAGVGELVAAIRDNVRRYRQAGIIGMVSQFESADFEEGVADYFAGERERGLALIAKAAEDGVFIMPEGGPQGLDDDPGFASLLMGQKARQARERQKFLAIVCDDNPYADVWQPMPETCEDVVEQSSL